MGVILTLVLGCYPSCPRLTDCVPSDTIFTVIPTLVVTSGREMGYETNFIKETVHGTV